MGLAVLVLALLTSADADNICEDERPLKCVRFGEQCEALSACGEWSADCNDCDPNITDSDWREVDHKWIKFLRGNGCHTLDSNCLATTSVDHTLLYANQAHCEVLVKAEAGLEFTRFHTEDNWDEVELVSLTDGQVLWTGSGRLGAFALPVVLETTTAFMWKTDATTQSKGWKACSGCPDAAQDTPDGQCQCVVAKGLETSCVDYNYTLRLAGLDFPWLTNCSTFDPKCRTCRCLSTTGKNKLQVRLIIRGMFQWMSHLVLWVAVAAPLPVALYLIITCLLAASDLCNVDRDSCREAVLRWTAWTSHVLRNGCCRGQDPCGRISGFWYLACVQCFWVWFQFKLWTEPQHGVTGLDLLAPMILWLFFCLSSGMIWYWHKLALKNASEEQDMETWVGGCRCFVCCCCFCNPLGCCFPMEVTDAHSAPPTLDAEKGQSPGQQSMESPEGTDSMLTIGKSQIGQLFKGLFSEEDKQKHSERFERLAHVSEEVDADSPYLMIWLWRIFLGGSPVHFKGSLVLVALHLTFWALVLAATSWAYENTFYSRARTMEDVYLEALGPGYKAPPSLHDPRVTLIADDGSILQGPRIVAGKRLYDAIHRFVPVVRNFTSSMRILPACLVVHYWCLALSVLIHAHFSRRRGILGVVVSNDTVGGCQILLPL
ncbi:unnamed protein product [Effrenium voratum]|nr:unnamed protein product [Effrenium voratum]